MDEGKGRLVPKADGDGIDLKDHSLDQQIFKDIIQGMNLYAKEIGKGREDSLVIPAWDTQNKTQAFMPKYIRITEVINISVVLFIHPLVVDECFFDC